MVRIFGRVAGLFWKYWPRAMLAYVALFAGAGFALLIPRLTGNAIDTALNSGDRRVLLLLTLGVIGAGVLRSFLGYWQTYLSEYLSQRVAYDIRKMFYNKLQCLSYSFHDASQTGQLMSRATADVEGVRQFVGFALLRGVYFVVLMIAVTVLLLGLNWKLALISLSVVPFISFRTIVINQKLKDMWAKIQQMLGALETTVQENLTGVRVVRAFAREKFESKKFRQQAENLYDQEIQVNSLMASNSPLMAFALALAMGGILWYGGRLVISGQLTQGELAQFMLYLVMLNMPIRMLGWMSILFSRAGAAGQRIFEILDKVSAVTEQPDAEDLKDARGEVRFENVSFSYDSHGDVLKNVDFVAPPGRVIALVGASGSGKSTIANLIPRFYDVTGGRITVDGRDIRDLTLASLRRHIGIVHQDTFLFSASLRENISYGRPDASLEQIVEAAKIARLHDFIARLPDGYETEVGERGITLSGGQKQRLAIARTILLNPRILIMDDSTSSVDTETEYLIQQALVGLLEGRTTFIIAHRLRSVQMADLILVMKDGEIVERGKHAELLGRGGIYRQVYALQFQHEESAERAATVIFSEQAAPQAETDEEGDGSVATAIHEAGKPALADASGQVERSLDPASKDLQLSSSLDESEDAVYGKAFDTRIFKRVAGYFAPFKVALPLTIAATVLLTFSNVAGPYLVGRAEDSYIVAGDLHGLNIIVLLFLGNAALTWAAYYTQILAEARLGQGIVLSLRGQVYDHLQRLPLKFFDVNKVGRIISRVMNDVGELADFLDSGALYVVGELVGLIAVVVALFSLNARLALLAMAVVPLLLIFVIFWQRKARVYFVQVRQAIAVVNSALQENITGVRVIQSLSREDVNNQRFDEVNKANFEANLASVRLSATMSPVVEMLMTVATAVIILYGGIGVLEKTIFIGTLLAFLLYIQRFFDPIRNMTMEYTQLQRTMASGNRLFELLDIKEEAGDGPGSVVLSQVRGDIRFENVSFSYDPGIEVLHDINLHVPAGKTVALVGPTGAGKTTMVSLIARFYDVTAGRILVDGHDLRKLDRTSYRQHMGLVLQDSFLFSDTVKENIRYGRLDATDEEIVAAAKAVYAHDFIGRLENGYDTMLQERGQNLSMGQRQLTSFARAILADPAIILLDEATANVDSYSEHMLQEGMKELLKGRTTVIIAHRLSTVRDADLIVVLEGGRIVERGRHEELLARGGLYARLYQMTYAAVGT